MANIIAGQGPGFHLGQEKAVNGCHSAKEVLLLRLQALARRSPERYTDAREKLTSRFGDDFFK